MMAIIFFFVTSIYENIQSKKQYYQSLIGAKKLLTCLAQLLNIYTYSTLNIKNKLPCAVKKWE